MKKNLLASAAAICGLLYATGAYAQSVTSTTLLPSANSMGGAVNPTTNVPDPGTVVVRFGGHANFYAAAMSDSGDKAPGFKQPSWPSMRTTRAPTVVAERMMSSGGKTWARSVNSSDCATCNWPSRSVP